MLEIEYNKHDVADMYLIFIVSDVERSQSR